MIFDGRAFAKDIEEEMVYKVRNFVKKPRIVSVMVGDDPASLLYTKLKQEAAQRLGIEFEIVKIDFGSSEDQEKELEHTVREIGEREDVTGLMVQLPLPENFKGSTLKVLGAIPLKKDVDGLRWEESGVMPATVRAVLSILDRIEEITNHKFPACAGRSNSQIVVVGARGAVGRPLVHFLKERGVQVSEVEWDTPEPTRSVLEGQVVISCTGKAGVVTGEMVQDGVIAIDVGAPKGDMTQDVYDKASVALAVPGGVGPVTIACLMKNATELWV